MNCRQKPDVKRNKKLCSISYLKYDILIAEVRSRQLQVCVRDNKNSECKSKKLDCCSIYSMDKYSRKCRINC